jgi:NhaP-type Na+/H+ or K+/H+ antiporter
MLEIPKLPIGVRFLVLVCLKQGLLILLIVSFGLLIFYRPGVAEDDFRNILSLICIVLVGHVAGKLSPFLGQEPMLGMLFSGIALRNTLPSIITPVPHRWTAVLWTMALASVIARAGLSLQKQKVVKHIFEALLLGIIPVITESVIIAFVARYTFALPASWAFTLVILG